MGIYKSKKGIEIEFEVGYGMREDYAGSLVKLHPDITWEKIDTDDYQGNIISIGYDKEGNWYYKNNSYGSCSGCDWIQGIETDAEAVEFYQKQDVLDELGKDIGKVKEYVRKEVQNCWGFEEEDANKLIKFIEESTA